MSYSNLTLYYDSKILPDKFYCVDSLSTYLSSLMHNNITIQYQKNILSLTREIKIDVPQISIEANLTNINYASISNDTNAFVYYYFVTNKEWLSENTLKLTLVMDTINTFKPSAGFTFSPLTKVLREHKDRYSIIPFRSDEHIVSGRTGNVAVQVDIGVYRYVCNYAIQVEEAIGIEFDDITIDGEYNTVTFDKETGIFTGVLTSTGPHVLVNANITATINERIKRIVDINPEGIQPLLYGKEKGYIRNELDVDWYLIYKGASNPKGYITASSSIKLQVASNKTINANSLSPGIYYYIMPITKQEDVSVNINNVVYNLKPEGTVTDLGDHDATVHALRYWKDGNDVKVELITFTYQLFVGYSRKNISDTFVISSFELSSSKDVKTFYTTSSESLTYNDILKLDSQSIIFASGGYWLAPINTVNRIDNDMIKIIKLPYCPINLNKESDGYTFDQSICDFDTTENLIKIKDITERISSSFKFEDTFNPYEPLQLQDLSLARTNEVKNPIYESKLFHSDFYQPKFVYDSFGYTFNLERADIIDYDYSKFEIEFVVTSTINSKFLFSFPQYISKTYSVQDYNNVLVIQRNNEMTIYNSDYLNYIKTGYNYDLKNKDRTQAVSWLGVGLGAVATVAGFASTAVTGGAGVAVGVSALTSTTAQIVGAVNTTLQTEQNQEAKLMALRNQSASVYGADDVDLMTAYTGNRAKFMLYEVSPRMKKALFDLFYYTGYVSNELKIPDMTSRTWFNFVACDIVFDSTYNITDDIMEDLIIKYQSGVTFMHRYNNNYDWNREKENWEISLNIQD